MVKALMYKVQVFYVEESGLSLLGLHDYLDSGLLWSAHIWAFRL